MLTETKRARIAEVMREVAADCEADALKLDSTAFSARGAGENFGNLYTAVQVVAKAVEALVASPAGGAPGGADLCECGHARVLHRTALWNGCGGTIIVQRPPGDDVMPCPCTTYRAPGGKPEQCGAPNSVRACERELDPCWCRAPGGVARTGDAE